MSSRDLAPTKQSPHRDADHREVAQMKIPHQERQEHDRNEDRTHRQRVIRRAAPKETRLSQYPRPHPILSHLYFAFGSATVCHCML
jgi:hypothetical protein